MKRKKKRMSTLTRVLLCSWCVLGLVSAAFLIKWAINLSPEGPEGSIGSFAQSGNDGDVVQQGGEITKAPKSTATPTLALTPTPVPPQAKFEKEYPHLGMMTEFYAYTEGVAYGFRYPCYDANTPEGAVVADAVADAAHQLMAEKVTELAKAEGSEKFLLIDYEDGETAGLYSVLFYIEKEADGVKTTETKPWIYNKKKGEPVDAEALFEDRAYLYVAEQINAMPEEKADVSEEAADGTMGEVTEEYKFIGTREEFPSYLLTSDGVKFYYNGDDPEGFVVIPYIAVHTYMAVTENGTVRADNIRELDPDKPMIALTFDDGPHYQNTPHLLEILEQYNAKSTFFVLGDRSHFTESNKKTVTLVAEAGHEVSSHTYSHKDLKSLSEDALIDEVVKARDNIYALTGEYPTYIRPPYGGYNDLVKKYAYAPLINWDLDSKDWSFRDVDKIVEHVLKEAEDGNIVLMHDIHWFTVDAVERLLPELATRGYQFVTVSELFYYNDVEAVNGTVYYGGYD
ncbi:MAG: polysaccharide deacetylase family protein [Lachnospiraceae bacterium]|nr:polysaccharide deacetylase family protein [Lachnospiraceae bacterium]